MHKITAAIIGATLLPVVASAQPPDTVRVQRDIASVYRTDKPFKTINIGNSQIVDIVALTDRSLIIQGHKTGSTNLIFLDRDNVPTKEVIVIVDEQGSGFVKIHNKALLNSYTMFSCWTDGCQFVGENTVSEPAPLPRGYLNQSVTYGGTGVQPPVPLSVTPNN